MTQVEFNKLSKALDFMCKDIMKSKGPEYTQEDTDMLANFKNTAERLNTTELKILVITSRIASSVLDAVKAVYVPKSVIRASVSSTQFSIKNSIFYYL